MKNLFYLLMLCAFTMNAQVPSNANYKATALPTVTITTGYKALLFDNTLKTQAVIDITSLLSGADNFWTKTGNDIRNNNIGNVEVKLQTAKFLNILNSSNSIVSSISDVGTVLGAVGVFNNRVTTNKVGNDLYGFINFATGHFTTDFPIYNDSDFSANTNPRRLVDYSELTTAVGPATTMQIANDNGNTITYDSGHSYHTFLGNTTDNRQTDFTVYNGLTGINYQKSRMVLNNFNAVLYGEYGSGTFGQVAVQNGLPGMYYVGLGTGSNYVTFETPLLGNAGHKVKARTTGDYFLADEDLTVQYNGSIHDVDLGGHNLTGQDIIAVTLSASSDVSVGGTLAVVGDISGDNVNINEDIYTGHDFLAGNNITAVGNLAAANYSGNSSGTNTGNQTTTGTTDRITVATGTTNPVIDISTTFEALLAKVANRIDQNNSATTSTQFASVVSDETGTGTIVYSIAPTLNNPIVGTQSANDNSTKAASTAYANALVQNSLSASITLSPSVTAVNTGLALKGNVADRIDQNNASTTSAQFASVISNETGTGVIVYNDSPTFTTTLTTPAISISGGNAANIMATNGANLGNGTTYVRTVTLGTDPGTSSALIVGSTQISNAIWQVYNKVNNLFIVNSTTVALSSATLNSTYSSVDVGTRVACPNIIAGGIQYTKRTEAGSSDVWDMITITVAP